MNRRLIVVSALVFIAILASCSARADDQPTADTPAPVEDRDGQEKPPKPADPIVGRWKCTNNLQTVTIIIQADGKFLIEDATMGVVRRNTWTRIDENRVSVYGGTSYEITFDGPDRFSLLNVSLRTTISCERE